MTSVSRPFGDILQNSALFAGLGRQVLEGFGKSLEGKRLMIYHQSLRTILV
ncbi:MAG: hypothetical protein GY927_18485 [bacterium]|nr:hypothetical protein [bacterium]